MAPSELLASQFEGTRAWTLLLLDDLAGDDWTYQPGAGLAHALWICGHLATAQDTLIHTRCLGTSVVDAAFRAHFPLGEPVRSAAEHDYPSIETVLATMADTHKLTCAAIRAMSEAFLSEPAFGADGKTLHPHPHYRDKGGAVIHANRHEAFHAGQIATLRRLRGKTFLR